VNENQGGKRMKLDDAQVTTIIAALRAYQAAPLYAREIDMQVMRMTDRPCDPLSDFEIDELCEELNFATAVVAD